jgi:hypothetical protein
MQPPPALSGQIKNNTAYHPLPKPPTSRILIFLFFDWPHADLISAASRLSPVVHRLGPLAHHFGGVPDSILGWRAPLPFEHERRS